MNGSGVYAHIWLSKSGSSLVKLFPTTSTGALLTLILGIVLMPSPLEAILATSRRTSSNIVSFLISPFVAIGLILLTTRANALVLVIKPLLILQTSSVSLTLDSLFLSLLDVDHADSDAVIVAKFKIKSF